MISRPVYFPAQGFLEFELTDEEILPLTQEIEDIQKNEFNAESFNHGLAGNIKKEFILRKSRSYVNDLLLPILWKYMETFGENLYTKVLKNGTTYELDNFWVNFQEKYEFNPTHYHTGVFSFVLWINLPYTKEKEERYFEQISPKETKNGHFSFYYTNALGIIENYTFLTDKSMEKKGIIFPSVLNHCVYPFFTSDDYRISVSGNFVYKN